MMTLGLKGLSNKNLNIPRVTSDNRKCNAFFCGALLLYIANRKLLLLRLRPHSLTSQHAERETFNFRFVCIRYVIVLVA